mmetsp:Transcript_90519/g.207179  ORF Transcript_90519/g.207179 Transcript_90519/m.207179 type:complete len:208 (+) Transcript_90519:558-1181(+)
MLVRVSRCWLPQSTTSLERKLPSTGRFRVRRRVPARARTCRRRPRSPTPRPRARAARLARRRGRWMMRPAVCSSQRSPRASLRTTSGIISLPTVRSRMCICPGSSAPAGTRASLSCLSCTPSPPPMCLLPGTKLITSTASRCWWIGLLLATLLGARVAVALLLTRRARVVVPDSTPTTCSRRTRLRWVGLPLLSRRTPECSGQRTVP